MKLALPKTPKLKVKPVKPKPLLIIATIFAASFSGRMVGFANAALDVSKKETKPEIEMASTDHSDKPDDTESHKDDASQTSNDKHNEKTEISIDKPVSAAHKAEQISGLLKQIRERSSTLDNKSREVEDRIRLLELIEARVEEKLAILEKRNQELSERVTLANEASKTDISQLAKMYEQMKPVKAGEIFNAMEPTFAAGFLTEMNSESAALILTNMSTEKAYAASMKIASRNASVHQQ